MIDKKELISKIKSIPHQNKRWYEKITDEELKFVLESVSFLNTDDWYKIRYYFVNELTTIKVCPICGRELKNNYVKGVFCSRTCQRTEKGKELSLKKAIKTSIERYGTDNPCKSQAIIDKIKQTSLKRYGATNPSKAPEIIDKIRQTNIKKRGVEWVFNDKNVIALIEQTNIEKYGCKNVFANKDIQEKIRNTLLDKYGAVSPNKLESSIRQDIINNNLRISYQKILKSERFKPLFDEEEWVQNHGATGKKEYCHTYKFLCKKCGQVFEQQLHNGFSSCRCPYCNPYHPKYSKYEQEIYEWLKSIGIENIERNKRDWGDFTTLYEADLYLPEHKLVIEYNGLYWHSNVNKDDDYHYNKWKFFKELGIKCIQIFGDEWRDKKNIVKDIIKKDLKVINPISLNMKNCIIKEIDKDNYLKFLSENYIFDLFDSDIQIGFYDKDVLLSTLGANKILYDNKEAWKIVLCSKIENNNTEIEKDIVKYFKLHYANNLDTIMEINTRYFNAKDYNYLNYTFLNHSSPNTFFFIESERTLYNNFNMLDKNKKNLLIFDSGCDIIKL